MASLHQAISWTNINIRMEKIRRVVTDMRFASLAAAQTVTTIPLQPGGLRGKNKF